MDERKFEGCYYEIADIYRILDSLTSSRIFSNETELVFKAAANLLWQFRQITFMEQDAVAAQYKLRELLARNGEG